MVLDRAFDSWWMKHFFVYKTEPGYLIKLMESTTTKKEKSTPERLFLVKIPIKSITYLTTGFY